ncbi:MAG: ankyrin repeat domain-containing protein [Bacteroidota bacterium]
MSVALRRCVLCCFLAAVAALPAGAQKKSAAPVAPPPPLVEAVQRGDRDAVQAALGRGADIEAADARGATALLWAALQGDDALVRLLLDAGADLQPPGAIVPDPSRSSYYGSPLAAAIARDHLDVLRLLVEEGGADVNQPEWNPEAQAYTGWTPLHYAAALGQVDALAYLLARGADAEVVDRFGLTPLARAVSSGMDATVRGLLDAGADFTVTDSEGTPLLVSAAAEGHRGTTLLLLDAGADPNGASPDGFTPLHMAALNGWTAVVERLLDAGADVEAPEPSEGATPLMVALVKNEVETFERLMARGADLDARDDKGHTVLHHVAMNGDPAFLDPVLARGADLDARSDHGETPLHVALVTEREEMALRLVAAGADVNVRDRTLWTPLHYAVRDGHLRVMAALREAGARIHWGKGDGWTPLHLAAHNGYVTMVQVLLCDGADPKVRTKAGATPDSLARAQGHDLLRSLFIEPACGRSLEVGGLRREGIALYQAGRYVEAVPVLENALLANELVAGRDHIRTIQLLADLANVYQDQGDRPRAAVYLEKAYARMGGRPEAYGRTGAIALNNLALERYRQEDYAEAERLLTESVRLLGLNDGTPTQQASLLVNLASLRRQLDDAKGGAAALSQALELTRADGGRTDRVARLLMLIGREYALIDHAATTAVYDEAIVLADSLQQAGALNLPDLIYLYKQTGLYYAANVDDAESQRRGQVLVLKGAAAHLDLLLQNLNQPQADLQHLLRERDLEPIRKGSRRR